MLKYLFVALVSIAVVYGCGKKSEDEATTVSSLPSQISTGAK